MVQPSADSPSGGLPGANRRCLSIKLHQSQLEKHMSRLVEIRQDMSKIMVDFSDFVNAALGEEEDIIIDDDL